MVNLTALNAVQAGIGLGGQAGIEQVSPKFDWDKMLGPMSSGLSLVSGLMDAANAFSAAKTLKGQAKQYRLIAAQSLEQGFQTGIDIEQEGKEFTGALTTAFGKSGSLLEGSPLLVLADTQTQIEKNVARAIQQGRIQEQAYLWQAKQAARAAKGQKMAGIAGIAKTAATFALA